MAGRERRDRPADGGRTDHPRPLRRPDGVVYALTAEHLGIIAELHRVMPNAAPVFDLDAIEPGLESIELVSQRLLERFRGSQDHRVFLVLCRVNAERVGDAIRAIVDHEGWPLDPEEVLADTYARLYRILRGQSAALEQRLSDAPSTYRLIHDLAHEVICERVDDYRAMCLPLPGLPQIVTAPPVALVDGARQLVEKVGWMLEEAELDGWVSFCLLKLERELRRALHLREQRGLSLEELGEELGCSRFEAAQRLRVAHQALRMKLIEVISAFAGSPLEQLEATDEQGEPEGVPSLRQGQSEEEQDEED